MAAGAKGRTKAEVGEIRHIYLDLDENGAESLKTLRERQDKAAAPRYARRTVEKACAEHSTTIRLALNNGAASMPEDRS